MSKGFRQKSTAWSYTTIRILSFWRESINNFPWCKASCNWYRTYQFFISLVGFKIWVKVFYVFDKVIIITLNIGLPAVCLYTFGETGEETTANGNAGIFLFRHKWPHSRYLQKMGEEFCKNVQSVIWWGFVMSEVPFFVQCTFTVIGILSLPYHHFGSLGWRIKNRNSNKQ